jgi:hypothetical protein
LGSKMKSGWLGGFGMRRSRMGVSRSMGPATIVHGSGTPRPPGKLHLVERLFGQGGVIIDIPNKLQSWSDFIGHPPIPGRPSEDEWRTLPRVPPFRESGTGNSGAPLTAADRDDREGMEIGPYGTRARSHCSPSGRWGKYLSVTVTMPFARSALETESAWLACRPQRGGLTRSRR